MNNTHLIKTLQSEGYVLNDGQELTSKSMLALYRESQGRLEIIFRCQYSFKDNVMAYSQLVTGTQLSKMDVVMSSMAIGAIYDIEKWKSHEQIKSIVHKKSPSTIKCNNHSPSPQKIAQAPVEPAMKKIHNVQKPKIQSVKAPVQTKNIQKSLQFTKTDKMEVEQSKGKDSDSDDHWIPKQNVKKQLTAESTTETDNSPNDKKYANVQSDDEQLLNMKMQLDQIKSQQKTDPVRPTAPKVVPQRSAPTIVEKVRPKEVKVQARIDTFFKKS